MVTEESLSKYADHVLSRLLREWNQLGLTDGDQGLIMTHLRSEFGVDKALCICCHMFIPHKRGDGVVGKPFEHRARCGRICAPTALQETGEGPYHRDMEYCPICSKERTIQFSPSENGWRIT